MVTCNLWYDTWLSLQLLPTHRKKRAFMDCVWLSVTSGLWYMVTRLELIINNLNFDLEFGGHQTPSSCALMCYVQLLPPYYMERTRFMVGDLLVSQYKLEGAAVFDPPVVSQGELDVPVCVCV